jgi:hypothetical protein
MDNRTSTMKPGGANNTSLKVYQPMNMIVFLTFYSPIIIIATFTSLSFIAQNYNGFIYLGFIMAAILVREGIYYWTSKSDPVNDGTICSSISFSKYGNSLFSAFVFAFTIAYVSIPMFMNGAPNLWIFISLIVYFLLDLFIRMYKKCVVDMKEMLINILGSVALAIGFVMAMYGGGSGKFLLFNEVSSNKDICYQPKEQTFKCQVYKDGTLVGNI